MNKDKRLVVPLRCEREIGELIFHLMSTRQRRVLTHKWEAKKSSACSSYRLPQATSRPELLRLGRLTLISNYGAVVSNV